MPDVSLRAALFVASGAVVGALSRWLVGVALPRELPWATLAVNVVGSFVLGVALFWPSLASAEAVEARLFLAVGLLGSFTTMSSFAFDTVAFAQAGRWGFALANALLNPILSVAAAGAGFFTARFLG